MPGFSRLPARRVANGQIDVLYHSTKLRDLNLPTKQLETSRPLPARPRRLLLSLKTPSSLPPCFPYHLQRRRNEELGAESLCGGVVQRFVKTNTSLSSDLDEVEQAAASPGRSLLRGPSLPVETVTLPATAHMFLRPSTIATLMHYECGNNKAYGELED